MKAAHIMTKCIECDKIISENITSDIAVPLMIPHYIIWVTCQGCKIKIIDTDETINDLNDYIKELEI